MRRRTVVIPLKRKRLGKTDYPLRFRLLSSGEPRLVVRKTLRNVYSQIISYDKHGDRVVASATSHELKQFGLSTSGRTVCAAYLVGYLLGMKAKRKDVPSAILDMGFYRKTKGSVIFACVKGVIDAGVRVPHSKEVFPSDDRIRGKHLKHAVPIDTIITTIQQKLGAGHE
jgi:large subunit ribosomal protein L18